MKKSAAICLLFALLLSCFAGCSKSGGDAFVSAGASTGGDASEKVTLTVFHQYNEELEALLADGACMRAMINQYKEDFPNVEVVEEGITDNWGQKLMTYSAAGDMPDVFQEIPGTTMSTIVKNGSALNLSEALNAETLGMYKQDLMEDFTFDGVVYGLPYYLEYQTAVMYNKEMWKEAGCEDFPKTWDELLSYKAYFDQKGVNILALGDQAQWVFSYAYFVPILTEATSVDWMRKVGELSPDISFEDPGVISALQTIQKIAPLFNSDWKSIVDTEATTQYLEEKASATINGQWIFSQMESSADDSPGMIEKSAYAMLPGTNDTCQYASGGIGCGFSVSADLAEEKGSAHYDAALNMLKYVTGKEYNTKMAERGYLPVIENLTYDESRILPIYKDFFEGVKKITTVKQFDKQNWDGQITTTLSAVLQDVATENMTPEDGAKELQNVYESLLF